MDLYENEKAKRIKKFPKYYITTFGRVWSTYSNKWLKPTINQRGNHKREYVSLGRGNKFFVHRLVAEAFIPNPNNYNEIDHIDCNALNNHVENLRWVTHQENMQNEKTQENVKNNTGYLVEIENIETGEITYGYEDTIKKYNISKSTLNNHLKGRVKNPKWQLTGKRINPNNVPEVVG